LPIASADALYQRALALYDLRRYPEAQAELRKALVHEPDRADAHAFLAMALLAQEGPGGLLPSSLEEALREARRAVGLAPDSPPGYTALAWAYLAARKPDDALRAAAQLLRLDPQSAQGWLLTSAGWFQKREWQKALQSAEGGLRIDPRSVGLLNNRSYALIMLGRAPEAAASTAQALTLDPQNDSAHTNRGWLAIINGDPPAALAHFREALRLDPLNEPARQGFLAALQSRNPLYRLLVRYSLWSSRFTRAESLIFIYGLASVSSVLGMAAQVFFPLYLLYLPWRVLYAIFSFFSWISDALFYLLLRFNRGGRLLLTKDEMAESNALAFCLIYFLANLGGLIWSGAWGFLAGMLLSFFMMVPAAAVFKLPARAKARRTLLAVLVSCLLAAGLCGQGLTFLTTPWAALPWLLFFVGVFSLPWIASLFLLFD
jgi:tetratricopeptide (TPR) repeat protein